MCTMLCGVDESKRMFNRLSVSFTLVFLVLFLVSGMAWSSSSTLGAVSTVFAILSLVAKGFVQFQLGQIDAIEAEGSAALR